MSMPLRPQFLFNLIVATLVVLGTGATGGCSHGSSGDASDHESRRASESLSTPQLPPQAIQAAATAIRPDPTNAAAVENPPLGSGVMSVSNAGDAKYHIPLWVPPGRAGIQPNLSLDYSSQAGNGLVGVGWSLSGLPSITRCRNPRKPNTTPRPLRFLSEDSFCLGGDVLVKIDDGTYRKLHDDHSRIEEIDAPWDPAPGRGPTGFVETTKDGRIFYYGQPHAEDTSGVIDERVRVGAYPGSYTVRVRWPLTRVVDRAGNFMNVLYTRQPAADGFAADQMELLPTEIDYTGHSGTPRLAPHRSVRLHYDQARDDARMSFMMGVETAMVARLRTLEMYGQDDDVVRTFSLTYEASPSTGRSRLKTVQECDGEPPTPAHTDVLCRQETFSYSDAPDRSDPKSTQFDEWSTPVNANGTTIGQLTTLDLDNDGRTDLLYATNPSPGHDPPGNTYRVRLSTGSGFGPEQDTGIHAGSNVQAADFNGDGHSDVFVTYAKPDGTAQFAVFLATWASNSWALRGPWNPSGPNGALDVMTQPYTSATAADVDADRFPDLVLSNEYQTVYVINQSGSAFAVGPKSNAQSSLDGLGFVDLNGDGQTDVLSAPSTPSTFKCGQPSDHLPLHVSSATRVNGTYYPDLPGTALDLMDCAPMQTYFGPSKPTIQPNLHNPIVFGDFNGDGLADVLTNEVAALDPPDGLCRVDGPKTVFGQTLRLNTGETFLPGTPKWGLLDVCDYDKIPAIAVETPSAVHSTRTMDWTEDGIDDVVTWTADNGHLSFFSLVSGANITPNGQKQSWTRFPADAFPFLMAVPMGFAVLDANGDGLDDVAFIDTDGTDTGNVLKLEVRHGPKPDLLTEAVGMIGPHSKVTYAPLADTSDDSCKAPVSCVHAGMWVPTQLDVVTGDRGFLDRMSSYTYKFLGGRYDGLLGTFLGFGQVDTFDKQSSVQTMTRYELSVNNDAAGIPVYPLAGLPYERQIRTTADGTQHLEGHAVTYTVRRTEAVTGGGAAQPIAPYDVVATVTTDRVTEQPHGQPPRLTSLNVVTRAFDAYGNVRDSVSGPGEPGTPSEHVVCSYENDRAAWRVANPTFCTTTSTSGAGESMSRQTAYEYDANDMLVRQTDDPGPPTGSGYAPLPQPQPDGVQTHYTEYHRDGTGLPTSIVSTDRNDGTGTRRVRTTTYDAAENMFPVTESDPMGHVTQTVYAPALGVVAAQVDANSLTTTTQYDGFGRPVLTVLPTSASIATSYVPPGRGPRGVPGGRGTFGAIVTTKQDPWSGTITTTDLLDEVGRVYSTGRSGDRQDGQTVDFGTTYDYAGRVTAITRPFFDSQSTGPWPATQTMYDSIGRVLRVTYPDGTAAHRAYLGPLTTTTDPQGKVRTLTADLLGRVVAATEANGTRGTVLTYGPFDTLEVVTDSGGTQSTGKVLKRTIYDRRGRPRVVLDADAAPQKLVYDAFGEVTDDVRGGAWDGTTFTGGVDTVTTYDLDGRPTRVVAGNVTQTTTWDPPGAIGKPSAATVSGGTSIVYLYDAYARLQSKMWQQATSSLYLLRIGYSYYGFGQLSGVDYPIGLDGSTKPLRIVYDRYAGGELADVRNLDTGEKYWQLESSDPTDTFQKAILGNQIESTWTEDPKNPGLPSTMTATSKADGTAVQALGHSWTGHGLLAKRTDSLLGVTDSYAYGDANQLTSWSHVVSGASGGTWNMQYAYSGLDNVTRQGESGLQPTYAGAAPHQPDTDGAGHAYKYDAHGNQVAAPGRTVTFDELDRMTSVTVDATGLTISRTTPSCAACAAPMSGPARRRPSRPTRSAGCSSSVTAATAFTTSSPCP